MPYFILRDGQIIRSANTLAGILKLFTGASDACVVKADPPRIVLDRNGLNLEEEELQPDLFNAPNGWHVSVEGTVYSLYYFEREYRYYTILTVWGSAERTYDSYFMVPHDDPAAAMRLLAATPPEQLAECLASSPENRAPEFREIPELLIRLALDEPEAFRGEWTLETWEHESPGKSWHRWITWHQKQYCILLSPEPLRDLEAADADRSAAPPVLWITGYYLPPDIENRLAVNTRSTWGSFEPAPSPRYRACWGRSALEAMNRVMQEVEPHIRAACPDTWDAVLKAHQFWTLLQREYFLRPDPQRFLCAPNSHFRHNLNAVEFLQDLLL